MERLTERFKGVGMTESEIMHNGHRWGPAFFQGNGYKEYSTILDRLAAYEDTGLAPDEIPHWISVSERLPEEDDSLPRYSDSTIELTSVLACGYLDGAKELSVQEVNRLLIKKTGITQLDINYTGEWEWSKCFKKVVFWQPLPQPPKEEK